MRLRLYGRPFSPTLSLTRNSLGIRMNLAAVLSLPQHHFPNHTSAAALFPPATRWTERSPRHAATSSVWEQSISTHLQASFPQAPMVRSRPPLRPLQNSLGQSRKLFVGTPSIEGSTLDGALKTRDFDDTDNRFRALKHYPVVRQ